MPEMAEAELSFATGMWMVRLDVPDNSPAWSVAVRPRHEELQHGLHFACKMCRRRGDHVDSSRRSHPAAVLGEGVVDLPRVFNGGRSELRSSREALAIRDAPASPRGVSSFVFVVTCNNPAPYRYNEPSPPPRTDLRPLPSDSSWTLVRARVSLGLSRTPIRTLHTSR